MSPRNSITVVSVLYFVAIGLALGAGISWLALNSWLGIGFLLLGIVLLVGIWAEMDFLTDIATTIMEPVWRSIARSGQQLAGADPDQPVDLGLRISFGLAFLAGLAGMILIHIPSEGGA